MPGDLHIGFICRRRPWGYRGSLFDRLAPLLRERGLQVEAVHAEDIACRHDERPPWDLVVLHAESAAALHLAAAIEAWGIPSINSAEATRLARDRLAVGAVLRGASFPVPEVRLAWLGGSAERPDGLNALGGWPVVVKSAAGQRGAGLWTAEEGEIGELAAKLPAGPYLIMEKIPHESDDLKVYVAGTWTAAIRRPFPVKSDEDKLGSLVSVPREVAEVTREVAHLLDLTCYGCDFVRGPGGWVLVDVNALPGYKGVGGAEEALVAEVVRVAEVLL